MSLQWWVVLHGQPLTLLDVRSLTIVPFVVIVFNLRKHAKHSQADSLTYVKSVK
jgi:hypothetical protein